MEGLSQEAEEAVPTKYGSVDDDDVPLFVRELGEGLFEDGFSCAGFSDDDGEAADEGLFFDSGVGVFLVWQELVDEFLVGFEGGGCGAEVCVDHGFKRG